MSAQIDQVLRAAAIYTQTLPFADARAFQLYLDFEAALYASR
jgi:hypothetical protein